MTRTRAVGFGLIAVGLVLTYNLFGSPANRLGGHQLDALMFFGPVILAAGILLTYRPKAGTPPESANAKILLYVGVACVVISTILLRTVAILGVLSVAFLGLPGLVLLAASPLIPRVAKIIGGIALAIPAGFMIVAVMFAMPKAYKTYVPIVRNGQMGNYSAFAISPNSTVVHKLPRIQMIWHAMVSAPLSRVLRKVNGYVWDIRRMIVIARPQARMAQHPARARSQKADFL